MFRAPKHHILIADNQDVRWVAADGADQGACVCQLPLDSFAGEAAATPELPEGLKRNPPSLGIVPDHWFGSETYPFRSSKPALIEAFLSRKLAESHAEQPGILQFFNYKHIPQADQAPLLYAGFLVEPRWYGLYPALRRLKQAPLRITSPGFLWEAHLQKTLPDFGSQAILLVQLEAAEGRLYFYHRGHYVFSRSVSLPDTEERAAVLIYEINQSLYLFSQKAKCEPDRLLLQADEPAWAQALHEALGREVTVLPRAAGERGGSPAAAQGALGRGLPAVADLRRRNGAYFNVIHRQVKREMEWRPVQMAALIVGLFLIFLLAGESVWLDRQLQGARTEQHMLRNEADAASSQGLDEDDRALDQVLQAAQQPSGAVVVLELLACLPSDARPKEIILDFAGAATVDLAAVLRARNPTHLIAQLNQIVAAIKQRVPQARGLSVEDIDVSLAPTEDVGADAGYLVRLRLELT